MRFADWIEAEGLSYEEAAQRIGVANGTVVWRYAHGRVPRPNILTRIVAATGGLVTPNDFHVLDPVPAAEAADPTSAKHDCHGPGATRERAA